MFDWMTFIIVWLICCLLVVLWWIRDARQAGFSYKEIWEDIVNFKIGFTFCSSLGPIAIMFIACCFLKEKWDDKHRA